MTAPRRSRSGRPKAITALADSPHYHKWLIHSDSGVGKTQLAGTAPDALFLTIEAQGTESARVAGSTAHQWVINNAADLKEARDYLRHGSGCDDYAWVNVDSLGESEDKLVEEILAEGRRKNPNRSLDKMALEDYQIRDTRVARFVDELNRLPINVIYTAHTMRFETEDEEGDDMTLLMPMVGSANNAKLSQKVCGKVTMVGHLAVVRSAKEEARKGRIFRRLYTEAHPGIFAKNRSGLGPYVDDPTVPKLLALAEEARGARTTTARSTRAARRTRRA